MTTAELLPKVTPAAGAVPVVVVGQDSYAALEAADKGDPRGKAAVEMIRAARAR